MANKILTDLPKDIKTGRIDRDKMVGMCIELEYKKKKYTVEVKSIFKGNDGLKRFIIEHDGYINEEGIDCQAFTNCAVGNM